MTNSLSNKNIHVISISPVPMMSSGKTLGVGMVSIFMLHKILAENSFKVSYLQCGNYTSDFFYDCPGVETIVISVPSSVFDKFKVIRKLFGFIFWFIISVFSVYQYVQKQKNKDVRIVLYGHMPQGAIMARVIGLLCGVPNISRFYGSLMSFREGFDVNYPVNYFKKLLNRLIYWEETLGLSVHADGYALTNDGTYLDKLCLEIHGKNINYYHHINGVSISETNVDLLYKSSLKDQLFGNQYPLIITAGRLMSWKRIDRVIEIAAELSSRGVDVNFLILGHGEDKEKLLSQIKLKKLANRVKILSGVAQSQVPLYLATADAYLSTQEYSNLTNTIYEAFSVGCPVVTLNVGDIVSVLTNKNSALANLPNLVKSCSDAVEKIITNDQVKNEFKAAMKDWNDENFISWDDRIKLDIKLIEKVISSYYKCNIKTRIST